MEDKCRMDGEVGQGEEGEKRHLGVASEEEKRWGEIMDNG